MEIREARPDDAVEISALLSQLGYEVPPDPVAARIARSGGHAVLVAAEPRGLLGVVEVQPRSGLTEAAWAEVTALVVDENTRRHGVGRALMGAAEDWARSSGLPSLRLRSNVVRGAAHVFYLRLGYSLVKTQHCFLRRL